MTAPIASSFPEMVRLAAEEHGDAVFLPRRHPKGGDPVTFRQLHADVQELAAGLLASGIQRGDHVALISENRYEWLLCDLACASIGAVDVPRGTDTPAAELEFILDHSGAVMAFAETDPVAQSILDLKLPGIRQVGVMSDSTSVSDAIHLGTLCEQGRKLLENDPDRLAEAVRSVGRDDLLTIVYTSGTTANPKGVMLSHGNVLSNLAAVEQVLEFGKEDVALSVLPSWHAYERIIDYILLHAGGKLVYSDRRRIKEDLKEVQPSVFAAVPRIWEMIHDGIVAACRKEKGFKRGLLSYVLENCRHVASGGMNPIRRLLHPVFKKSILPKFLAATGGNLRVAVSGGGALPAHVDKCLLGMGLPLLNGYGLTETSPVASVRTLADNRPGTIGPPLPETQIEIRGEDGKPLPNGQIGIVHIRGPQVMQGYYNNPEQTNAVLQDSWFNSGDLGCIDKDGQYRITGRAKDTIVLAGGENVEPERIETMVKTSPFIEQIVVVGQDKKSLGALIVPLADVLEEQIPRDQWQLEDGVLNGKAVRDVMRQELDRIVTADNGFRPIEKIAKFAVLAEPLTIENGFLTQTLKVRRHIVHQEFEAHIEGMFA